MFGSPVCHPYGSMQRPEDIFKHRSTSDIVRPDTDPLKSGREARETRVSNTVNSLPLELIIIHSHLVRQLRRRARSSSVKYGTSTDGQEKRMANAVEIKFPMTENAAAVLRATQAPKLCSTRAAMRKSSTVVPPTSLLLPLAPHLLGILP